MCQNLLKFDLFPLSLQISKDSDYEAVLKEEWGRREHLGMGSKKPWHKLWNSCPHQQLWRATQKVFFPRWNTFDSASSAHMLIFIFITFLSVSSLSLFFLILPLSPYIFGFQMVLLLAYIWPSSGKLSMRKWEHNHHGMVIGNDGSNVQDVWSTIKEVLF